MSHADLTLDGWLGLTGEAAGRVAAAVARSVDGALTTVAPHTYAGRTGRTALFDVHGVGYALVPGGTVRLGHDPARFVPTDGQRADFAEAASAWDLPSTIGEFIASRTSRARTVTVPALLVAVQAEVADDVIEYTDDDEEQDVEQDHAWVVAALADRGTRLPSPDEWEHACAAGAATLFRWGDEYPAGDPYGDVPLIKDPNLFGLLIGADPYQAELTADPLVLCGGDGGAALCGGYGSFLSWLTLATAYREPELAKTMQEGGLIAETPIRQVIAVP